VPIKLIAKEFNFRSHRNMSCRCCGVNPTCMLWKEGLF